MMPPSCILTKSWPFPPWSASHILMWAIGLPSFLANLNSMYEHMGLPVSTP